MPEMLDIVDENGVPTGRSVPRTTAHAEGCATAPAMCDRAAQSGRVQVLLQMRCAAKDSYPAATIFPAGHIPAAGVRRLDLRELREELV